MLDIAGTNDIKNDISRPRFAYAHLLVVSKCKSHHVRVWIGDEAHLISVRRARIKGISVVAYAYSCRICLLEFFIVFKPKNNKKIDCLDCGPRPS